MTRLIILPIAVALVIAVGMYATGPHNHREPFLPLLGLLAPLIAKPIIDKVTNKGGGGGGPPRTNPAPKSGCRYKTRSWINNGWGCEPGWADTGADWQYGDNGDKQCENCTALPEGNTVTVWEHTGFFGQKLELSPGKYPDLNKNGWNDRISSIRIPRGFKVILAQHDLMRGYTLTLEAGEYGDLNHWGLPSNRNEGRDLCENGTKKDCWNDQVTSVEVIRV